MIVSIIFLVLSLILGDIFILFPFFVIIPLSCGIRRRPEETINTENTSYGNYGNEQNFEEKNPKVEEKRCASCNNIISEQNLRFCPHCGTKL